MLTTVFAFSGPLRVLGITGMQTLWISLKQMGGLRVNLTNHSWMVSPVTGRLKVWEDDRK